MTVTVSASHATTSPIPTTPPAADPAVTSPKLSDAASLNQNFDQFLTLLTTQLKNQDPLSPMDSSQFTNQLVSFSGVEQQIKMNANLTKLLATSNAAQTTLGLNYIGLNIPLADSKFQYPGDGTITTSYTLPNAAATNTISILDKNGSVVYAKTGELPSGTHNFVWDGTDQAGLPVPAGQYTIQVNAIDNTNKSIAATTVVPAHVIGIETASDGSINLIISGQTSRTVPLSAVTSASI